MKVIKLLPILAILLGFVAFCPRTAHAHGGPYGYIYASLDMGWEELILKEDRYEKYDHGFMTSITAGFSMFVLGFGIEQDLGYIHMKPSSDSLMKVGVVPAKDERLFKGATIFSIPFMIYYEVFGVQLRVGIGASYMEGPSGTNTSVQSWFAFRTALCLIGGVAPFNGGIEIVYTLNSGDDHVFNNKDISHFFGVKLKFVFVAGGD